MKYVWSACGLLMIAIPAFFFEKSTDGQGSAETISSRTSSYVTSRQLLVRDSALLFTLFTQLTP